MSECVFRVEVEGRAYRVELVAGPIETDAGCFCAAADFDAGVMYIDRTGPEPFVSFCRLAEAVVRRERSVGPRPMGLRLTPPGDGGERYIIRTFGGESPGQAG